MLISTETSLHLCVEVPGRLSAPDEDNTRSAQQRSWAVQVSAMVCGAFAPFEPCSHQSDPRKGLLVRRQRGEKKAGYRLALAEQHTILSIQGHPTRI